MRIAEKIKNLRIAAGLSKSQLAQEASLGRSAVRQIESGEAKFPRIDSVVAIATALNVSMDELIKGVDFS